MIVAGSGAAVLNFGFRDSVIGARDVSRETCISPRGGCDAGFAGTSDQHALTALSAILRETVGSAITHRNNP